MVKPQAADAFGAVLVPLELLERQPGLLADSVLGEPEENSAQADLTSDGGIDRVQLFLGRLATRLLSRVAPYVPATLQIAAGSQRRSASQVFDLESTGGVMASRRFTHCWRNWRTAAIVTSPFCPHKILGFARRSLLSHKGAVVPEIAQRFVTLFEARIDAADQAAASLATDTINVLGEWGDVSYHHLSSPTRA